MPLLHPSTPLETADLQQLLTAILPRIIRSSTCRFCGSRLCQNRAVGFTDARRKLARQICEAIRLPAGSDRRTAPSLSRLRTSFSRHDRGSGTADSRRSHPPSRNRTLLLAPPAQSFCPIRTEATPESSPLQPGGIAHARDHDLDRVARVFDQAAELLKFTNAPEDSLPSSSNTLSRNRRRSSSMNVAVEPRSTKNAR